MGGGEVARSITKHGVDRIHSVVFASGVPPYLMQTEQQRQQALALCKQADKKAALACMAAFATTDFREDLPNVVVPTLVIHGDGDATVPFEGSGKRTHAAIGQSELVVLEGAPHGCNVSHAQTFNQALLDFLAK